MSAVKHSLLLLSFMTVFSPFASAGLGDWITGKVTSPPTLEQWASEVYEADYISDSNFFDSKYQYTYAKGPQNGNDCTAYLAGQSWCKLTKNGKGRITLLFDTPVQAKEIKVFLAGSSTSLDALNIQSVEIESQAEGTDQWITVWNEQNNNKCTLSITDFPPFLTKSVRITTLPGSWGCVDAVQLIGEPIKTTEPSIPPTTETCEGMNQRLDTIEKKVDEILNSLKTTPS